MAYEIPGFSFTLVSAADLRTDQFHFVNIDATGKAALAAAGTRVAGVIQNKPNAGHSTTLVVSGVSKVVAGGVVTAGDDVSSDSTGRAVTTVGTAQRAGIALTSAGAAGVLISVLLMSAITVGAAGEIATLIAAIPVAAVATVAGNTPAGGSGATAGAYDTAAHRDELIATVAEIKASLNDLLTKLRTAGIVTP